jgi:hypothetical protein
MFGPVHVHKSHVILVEKVYHSFYKLLKVLYSLSTGGERELHLPKAYKSWYFEVLPTLTLK